MSNFLTKLVGLFTLLFLSSCNSSYVIEISSLLDIDTATVLKEQVIEDCTLCKEGITIYKIELDSKTVESFLSKENKRFPDYIDSTWFNYGWFSTPVNPYHTKVFNHLNYISKRKVETVLLEIKKTLDENGIYYAFYIRQFKEDLDPLGAQIFVLNPNTKILYIVISIT